MTDAEIRRIKQVDYLERRHANGLCDRCNHPALRGNLCDNCRTFECQRSAARRQEARIYRSVGHFIMHCPFCAWYQTYTLQASAWRGLRTHTEQHHVAQ